MTDPIIRHRRLLAPRRSLVRSGALGAALFTALLVAASGGFAQPIATEDDTVPVAGAGPPIEAPAIVDTARARRRAGNLLRRFGEVLPCPLRTVVRLRVDREGEVTRVSVIEGSGSEIFDGISRRFAGALRFRPARHRGRPLAAGVLLPVRRACGEGTGAAPGSGSGGGAETGR